ncbi:hypothetical protein [Litoribacter populi]|uniref:hypothetical protein n=1 Tax=Litoribacter populi TaxID=2598460 RepID=UPI0011815103|nr:hypothetical protein [Litoribacter populi]
MVDSGIPSMIFRPSSAYLVNYGIELGHQVANFDLGLSITNNSELALNRTFHTVIVGLKTV